MISCSGQQRKIPWRDPCAGFEEARKYEFTGEAQFLGDCLHRRSVEQSAACALHQPAAEVLARWDANVLTELTSEMFATEARSHCQIGNAEVGTAFMLDPFKHLAEACRHRWPLATKSPRE